MDDRVLEDIHNLTYGTIARLIGSRNFNDIDDVYNEWVEFMEDHAREFQDWYEAWEGFNRSGRYYNQEEAR